MKSVVQQLQLEVHELETLLRETTNTERRANLAGQKEALLHCMKVLESRYEDFINPVGLALFLDSLASAYSLNIEMKPDGDKNDARAVSQMLHTLAHWTREGRLLMDSWSFSKGLK